MILQIPPGWAIDWIMYTEMSGGHCQHDQSQQRAQASAEQPLANPTPGSTSTSPIDCSQTTQQLLARHCDNKCPVSLPHLPKDICPTL